MERIEIYALGDEASTLAISRNDQVWVLENRSGYPIDFEELLEFLDKLASAELIEEKTAKAELLGRLGLAASGEDDAVGVAVRIGAKDLSFELIVGHESNSGRGSFVRYPGSDQAYLASEVIEVSTDAVEWLDPVVINIDSNRVLRVEVLAEVMQSALPLVAQRNAESGDIELQGIPLDADLKYPSVADGLARMLVNLRFEDVEPYDSERWSGAGLTTVTLDSGEVLEVRTIETTGEYWLHLLQQYQQHQPPQLQEPAYAGIDKWQYKVSQYVFNEFNKTMTDMLKSPEPE